jgi:hypothetical protein
MVAWLFDEGAQRNKWSLSQRAERFGSRARGVSEIGIREGHVRSRHDLVHEAPGTHSISITIVWRVGGDSR